MCMQLQASADMNAQIDSSTVAVSCINVPSADTTVSDSNYHINAISNLAIVALQNKSNEEYVPIILMFSLSYTLCTFVQSLMASVAASVFTAVGSTHLVL